MDSLDEVRTLTRRINAAKNCIDDHMDDFAKLMLDSVIYGDDSELKECIEDLSGMIHNILLGDENLLKMY